MTDLTVSAKVSGMVNLKIIRGETGLTQELTFSNTILNNYLTNEESAFSRFEVGTDTTVSPSDTTINSLGGSNSVTGESSGYKVVGTVISNKLITTCTFPVGAIIGNASSIGIRNNTSSSATLIIKTLIKNQNGEPLTISLGGNDQVIITHELTITVDQKPIPILLNIDGTEHSFQFFSGKLKADYSSPTRLGLASPYLFTNIYDNPYFGTMIMASSVTVLNDGNFTSKIPLGSSIVLPMSYARDYTEVALGKSNTNLVATASGINNFTNNDPISFIGWADKSSPASNCFGGFSIEPGLPKDNTIAYEFTIKITLSR